jgi:2-polyprenyl-3-methyl-5-hydroxy-6-metoxy-1,4-benzoquinol methylase
MNVDRIPRIIQAYDAPIVRAYCRGRFLILRQRFLDEIGQYLPPDGEVLDVGCGFGLFSLYYADTSPGRSLHGIDLNARRIELARSAAGRLGIDNVRYSVGDAAAYKAAGPFAAIYMLDLIHHIPVPAVRALIGELRDSLRPGGRLIIKDVDDRPFYKRWFTWLLDKAMDPSAAVNYWSQEAVLELLAEAGFRAYRHAMVDILPYPHVVYVCERID